jgi:hypothetical protein
MSYWVDRAVKVESVLRVQCVNQVAGVERIIRNRVQCVN